MPVWSAEIKELERLYESLKGQLPELEKELGQLIQFEDPNVILLYSRRCLEVIITDFCECELKRPRGSEPLKGIIDKLNKEKQIPAHIASSMYGLNEISTYGTHPKGFDPEQVKPVLNNLNIIIKWYLKYKEFDINQKTRTVEIFDKKPKKVIDFDQRKPITHHIPKWRSIIPWLLVGLMAIFISIYLIWNSRPSQTISEYKSIFNLQQGETLAQNSPVAFSPDGLKIVFVVIRNDTAYLSLKMNDEFEAKILSGTEGASAPFFSPDSRWIAFFSNGILKRISSMGGTPQIICEAKSGLNGCWGKDNIIIFSNTNNLGLMKVYSSGSTPEQITNAINLTPGEESISHFYPQLLPENEIILFTAYHNSEDMRIDAFSPKTEKRWTLIKNGSNAKYIRAGYLVYLWKGDLMAVPFNLKMMEVIGEPMVVMKGIAHFSTTDDGSLAYIPGNLIENNNKLIIINKNQESEPLNITSIQSPRFSPDGLQILHKNNSAFWIYNLERRTNRLLTERDYDAYWGVWTPDGKEIIYNSNQAGAEVNLFCISSDGQGSAVRLINSKLNQVPWYIYEKKLIYTELNPETGMDIFMIQLNGDTIPEPLIKTRFNDTQPNLSKNGKWLAYMSDESGQEEVYVCSFPDLENKTLISKGGGVEPLWSPDGKNLYYRDRTGQKLMSVSFKADEEISIGDPELLFQGDYQGQVGIWGRNYDIASDGNRFIMLEKKKLPSTATQINIVLNWSKEVEELVQTFNKNK